MGIGKKTWVFVDGDLPPQGDREPLGHEALVMTNSGERDAEIRLEILFEDREPVDDVVIRVPAKRVRCIRLDYEIGDEKTYQIPKGQYSLVLRSSEPIVAVFGRLDRRKDCAYYALDGFGE